jgi:hypothetical protein
MLIFLNGLAQVPFRDCPLFFFPNQGDNSKAGEATAWILG